MCRRGLHPSTLACAVLTPCQYSQSSCYAGTVVIGEANQATEAVMNLSWLTGSFTFAILLGVVSEDITTYVDVRMPLYAPAPGSFHLSLAGFGKACNQLSSALPKQSICNGMTSDIIGTNSGRAAVVIEPKYAKCNMLQSCTLNQVHKLPASKKTIEYSKCLILSARRCYCRLAA